MMIYLQICQETILIPPNDLSPNGGGFNNLEDDTSTINDTLGNGNLEDLYGKDIPSIEDDINTLENNENIAEFKGTNFNGANSKDIYLGEIIQVLKSEIPSLEKDIDSLGADINKGNIPNINDKIHSNKNFGNKGMSNKNSNNIKEGD